MSETIAPSRDVAARALVRVWQEDAFASAALDAELSKRRLDPRDAALATELCYGVLRVEPALLDRLRAVSDRFRAPSGLVRAHLLIGAYTLCFLDRIPPFAAVSEAVEASRRVADPKVGGFVNAVLRRLAADVEKKGRPKIGEMIAASCPAWLRAAIGRALSKEEVPRFLADGPSTPPHALCVADPAKREAILERLRAEAKGATFELGSVSPRAIRVSGAGDLRQLAGYGRDFIAQEEGAQAIAVALGAKPGERVLDACAGHGNKTWLLAREVGETGAVDAADLHAKKLRAIDRAGDAGDPAREAGGGDPAAASPGVRSRAFAIDWSQVTGAASRGEIPGDYDRVLVDAPCSGTGTLRRRPEIVLRRKPDDIARLAELQLAILRGAATCVRDGGRLVYAVCSVLREEAEDVVNAAIAKGAADGATLVPVGFDTPSLPFGQRASFRLLPHVNGTDGYFAASFVVRRSKA